jgi:hypothetical protein
VFFKAINFDASLPLSETNAYLRRGAQAVERVESLGVNSAD